MSVTSIIIAIIMFSIIILFHELGHFLLAKANGIRVNEFSLGLGPTLVGFTKGETKYSLKLLPFGGACQMEGEDDTSEDERSFNSKSVWARISVVAAGPIFNFIMAFIFSVVIIGCIGVDKPVLKDVMDGFPAQEAGLQAGDEIIKMDGQRIHFYRDISIFSTFHSGEAIEIVYERDGQRYEAILAPKLDEESGRYLYGLVGQSARENVGVFGTVKYAWHEVGYWIRMTIQSLKMMVTGGASVNDLSGPVGIVQNIGNTYEESLKQDGFFYAFLNMLNWAILLSANLGVMNLLPLPALDGGRLLFMFVEVIRGKKIKPEREGIVHLIGIILLLALMVFVMFNDIRKLFI